MRRWIRGELNMRTIFLLMGGNGSRFKSRFLGKQSSWVMEFFQVVVLTLLVIGIPSAGATEDKSDILLVEGVTIRVEDTETRVGIAKVRLQISPLKVENDRVIGKYRLRVPLLSSKNDDGLIDLEFQQELSVIFQTGGILEGDGISTTFKEDPPRGIICEIFPDKASKMSGKIILTIQTTDRKLRFKSRYKIVKDDPNEAPVAGELAEWRSE